MGASASTEKDAANTLVLNAYLARIGFCSSEAQALMTRPPNAEDLSLLLTKHLTSVPFENLGQHCHPAEDGAPEVAKCDPTLKLEATLQKIVFDRRGGFCWEINFAFAWLLRSLGYVVRVANCNVITPGGPVPGHLCLFVDKLGPLPLLVDPGFGDAPRVPVPVSLDSPVSDSQIGDQYTLVKNDPSLYGQTAEHGKRFDMTLMRSRKTGMGGSAMAAFFELDMPPTAEMTPPEPLYIIGSSDNLPLDCQEFVDGLASVLVVAEQNFFSQKRMCLLATESGYVFVGKDYVKTIEHGKEVSRTQLTGEKAWREAIASVAGVNLTPDQTAAEARPLKVSAAASPKEVPPAA